MEPEPRDYEELGMTEEEVDLLSGFSDDLITGRNPSIEEWCARLPGAEEKLRPLMETVVKVREAFLYLKEKHPRLDARKELKRLRKVKETRR